MTRRFPAIIQILAGLPLACGCLLAAAAPDFQHDIVPILSRYCFQCHGDSVKMGELDLRSPAVMLQGGVKGPSLAPGEARSSLLYTRIMDKSMPMGPNKVSEADAEIIRNWIDNGAPGGNTVSESESGETESGHWAFRPPQRPAVPKVSDSAAVRTPVDAFLVQAMQNRGVSAVREADRLTWLRRVYLDLIGLPPTPPEQAAFLADTSTDAWDKVVEDLLARPQYGERWARRWLDVARYAETNGYERDGTKPSVWRYRDYVIDAFNKDKPYDRFVVEQLAGDEVEGSNAETQIATTFLRLGTWDDEPADPVFDRFDQLDDVLGVTAAAFMGVTLRCARCHDHKFEPFTQKDYYQTLAAFTPLKRPQEERTEFDRLVGTPEELAVYRAATERADAQVAVRKRKVNRTRQAVMKRMFGDPGKKRGDDVAWLSHAEVVLAFSTAEDNRTDEQKKLVEQFNARLEEQILKEAETGERDQIVALRDEIKAIDDARPPELPRAYIWYEEGQEAPVTKILERGDPSTPGESVEPSVPAVLGTADASSLKPARESTGRRLWFARWLTQPSHPLTARVMVNRIWQGHFGEGLVASENDFGVMGQRPANPELLDYLASEFVASGWSVKHIHRLIVKSAAYRRSADWNEQAGKIDPDNVLLWRWQPRRLAAEVVRDSMLAVSGELNLQAGGPSIYPELPRTVLEGQSRPGEGWGKSEPPETARRSIYIFAKRSLAVPELEVLDAPDTTSSCEQRVVSTTGPQALTFLNGDFTQGRAQALAARLGREGGKKAEQQAALAYTLAYGRAPRPKEIELVRGFLREQERQIASETPENGTGVRRPQERALEAFALVVLNSNEFFYVN